MLLRTPASNARAAPGAVPSPGRLLLPGRGQLAAGRERVTVAEFAKIQTRSAKFLQIPLRSVLRTLKCRFELLGFGVPEPDRPGVVAPRDEFAVGSKRDAIGSVLIA